MKKGKFNFSQLDEAEQIRLINLFGSFLIVFILGISIFTAFSRVSKVNAQIEENDKKIIAIRDEIMDTNEKIKDQPDSEDVKKTYASAEKAGSEVASLQNEYKDVNIKSENFEENIERISQGISKYFTEDTANQTARTPWYLSLIHI